MLSKKDNLIRVWEVAYDLQICPKFLSTWLSLSWNCWNLGWQQLSLTKIWSRNSAVNCLNTVQTAQELFSCVVIDIIKINQRIFALGKYLSGPEIRWHHPHVKQILPDRQTLLAARNGHLSPIRCQQGQLNAPMIQIIVQSDLEAKIWKQDGKYLNTA